MMIDYYHQLALLSPWIILCVIIAVLIAAILVFAGTLAFAYGVIGFCVTTTMAPRRILEPLKIREDHWSALTAVIFPIAIWMILFWLTGENLGHTITFMIALFAIGGIICGLIVFLINVEHEADMAKNREYLRKQREQEGD